MSDDKTEATKGSESAVERLVMCECGKGYIVETNDGESSCTDTLRRYIAKYGELPGSLTPILGLAILNT